MPVPRLDWSSAATVDHAAGTLSPATHNTPNTTPSPREPRLDRCKSPIVVLPRLLIVSKVLSESLSSIATRSPIRPGNGCIGGRER